MLFLKKCQRIFVAPVSMFFRKITRKLNPQNIASKVASDVKQSVKGLTAKPTSIKEYFLIGDKYVAKKLVWAIAIAVLLIAIGITVYGYFARPDYAVALDVTHAHTPDAHPSRTVPAGSGANLGIGPHLNRKVTSTLRRLADENNIPYTYPDALDWLNS